MDKLGVPSMFKPAIFGGLMPGHAPNAAQMLAMQFGASPPNPNAAPNAFAMAAQWAPLFAAAAAANQAQTNHMAMVATDLSTNNSSTKTSPKSTEMKPSNPFMIASLLEAATQHQASQNAHLQHSPSSEREGRHLIEGSDESGDDDTDGSGMGGGKKARKARTIFTDKQLQSLEDSFEKQKYLSVQDRMDLANRLNLSDTQVKTWYQNRRTKWKRQTAVGMELLAEAGNFAAVQQILQRANPFWQNALSGSGNGGMVMPPGMPPMAFGGAVPPPGFMARFGGGPSIVSPSSSSSDLNKKDTTVPSATVPTATVPTATVTQLESPSESDESSGVSNKQFIANETPSRKRKLEAE